jgi:hypothetical protein
MVKCGVLFAVRTEFLNALPALQPAFTRRTSEHRLGTFLAENVSLSLLEMWCFSPLSLHVVFFLSSGFKLVTVWKYT